MPPQLTILGDILPEEEAAGPPAATTRSISGWLQRCVLAFRRWRQRDTGLHELSDRQLMDIGLTRGEIDCIDAGRSIERLRNGTEYLWHTRGVL